MAAGSDYCTQRNDLPPRDPFPAAGHSPRILPTHHANSPRLSTTVLSLALGLNATPGRGSPCGRRTARRGRIATLRHAQSLFSCGNSRRIVVVLAFLVA